ncbi:MAG: tRNA adenosine(34) deaminase TadA [Gammaproteobacteria bacterium CG11_big_fil_rev_8_21_14_0_20_46_22]|nr:MAG: tRNA adenosine(34) deaminase TadA [Gammaproteobacteria bacterium CG12_big_fil_rev_8_21_14_0_65_46_12]PIR10393.1 MAG: tRNA adenosine(34) deaminase TadA [Gammaproteobacteria bacterium CG11_big_fil_rev_8_21_14_0_20_46_22]
MKPRDEEFMHEALAQARLAELAGEVPVGAVLVKEGHIIAKAHNQPISECDPTAHAEIQVLRQAAKALGNYRLLDTTLYVTLEPCAMCAMALVHARVKRLVFAASDPRTGACGSVFQLASNEALNHRLSIESGVLAESASSLLQAFFKSRR